MGNAPPSTIALALESQAPPSVDDRWGGSLPHLFAEEMLEREVPRLAGKDERGEAMDLADATLVMAGVLIAPSESVTLTEVRFAHDLAQHCAGDDPFASLLRRRIESIVRVHEAISRHSRACISAVPENPAVPGLKTGAMAAGAPSPPTSSRLTPAVSLSLQLLYGLLDFVREDSCEHAQRADFLKEVSPVLEHLPPLCLASDPSEDEPVLDALRDFLYLASLPGACFLKGSSALNPGDTGDDDVAAALASPAMVRQRTTAATALLGLAAARGRASDFLLAVKVLLGVGLPQPRGGRLGLGGLAEAVVPLSTVTDLKSPLERLKQKAPVLESPASLTRRRLPLTKGRLKKGPGDAAQQQSPQLQPPHLKQQPQQLQQPQLKRTPPADEPCTEDDEDDEAADSGPESAHIVTLNSMPDPRQFRKQEAARVELSLKKEGASSAGKPPKVLVLKLSKEKSLVKDTFSEQLPVSLGEKMFPSWGALPTESRAAAPLVVAAMATGAVAGEASAGAPSVAPSVPPRACFLRPILDPLGAPSVLRALRQLADAKAPAGNALGPGSGACGGDMVTEVWSCGQNSYGELGHEDCVTRRVHFKVAVLEGRQVRGVAAGNEHTVVLLRGGEVLTVGYNDNGQCGQGTTGRVGSLTAVERLAGMGAAQVHTYNGSEHTVVVLADGRVVSFGYNYRGQLGHGGTSSEAAPKLVRGLEGRRVVDVSCSYYHTFLACDDGAVLSFGRGDHGQLAHGDNVDQKLPRLVESLRGKRTTSLACGQYHTCVTTTEGAVLACGKNDYGQVGVDASASQRLFVPVELGAVGGATAFATSVKCGYYHTVTLCRSGKGGHVFGWGRCDYGQVIKTTLHANILCGPPTLARNSLRID